MSRSLIVGALFPVLTLNPGSATDRGDAIMARATQLFGAPLSVEYQVFRLNETYVIWLIVGVDGNLLEGEVGPKFDYGAEFPTARKPSIPEYLSGQDYEDALRRISELKDLGAVQERHGSAVPSDFGLLNTDRFESAFVDRIVEPDEAETIRRFSVYFLQTLADSPEQVLTLEGQPMVCLRGGWYYLPLEEARTIKLGKWQTMRLAGPNHHLGGCLRTTVLYDADGFTIEQPQNETIVLSDLTVRALAGRVLLSNSDEPLEGVNVEVRGTASGRVLRRTTDSSGEFAFSGLPEGKYKFKVTRDGFKALSGFIFVDRKARAKLLSFKLDVGT